MGTVIVGCPRCAADIEANNFRIIITDFCHFLISHTFNLYQDQTLED